METDTSKSPAKSFEGFDLLTAIVLGFAAIATAFASFQSSLYDGKSAEAYSLANKQATQASSEQSRAIVEMTKDNSIDVQAMRLTLEGDDAKEETDSARNFYIATYLYTTQMSEAGYKALGLPPEARTSYNDDIPDDKADALQGKLLMTAMEKDLASDDNYRTSMLAKSQQLFAEAEKTFKEGQNANETGDKFQLVAVIYAISLFFGGITQVFQSNKLRWIIMFVGIALMGVATVYLFQIPWTFS